MFSENERCEVYHTTSLKQQGFKTKKLAISQLMAVREGFEPSIRLQTVYSLSRGAPSASRPPHRFIPW